MFSVKVTRKLVATDDFHGTAEHDDRFPYDQIGGREMNRIGVAGLDRLGLAALQDKKAKETERQGVGGVGCTVSAAAA